MIQFDVYPRDVKLDGENSGTQVTETDRKVVVDTYLDTFTTDGKALELCRVAMQVTIHNPECSITTVPQTHELQLTKQTPEPFVIQSSPDPTINPDGSYDFLPEVTGGVGPYDFVLEGSGTGFEFNSGTGRLTRPPQ